VTGTVLTAPAPLIAQVPANFSTLPPRLRDTPAQLRGEVPGMPMTRAEDIRFGPTSRLVSQPLMFK
jgi:hypothetical protein